MFKKEKTQRAIHSFDGPHSHWPAWRTPWPAFGSCHRQSSPRPSASARRTPCCPPSAASRRRPPVKGMELRGQTGDFSSYLKKAIYGALTSEKNSYFKRFACWKWWSWCVSNQMVKLPKASWSKMLGFWGIYLESLDRFTGNLWKIGI